MRATLAALVAAAALPGAAAAAQPPTVDGYGLWSLQRLGSAGLELDATQLRPAASVPVSFMPGARQGPSSWYLGHLEATVTLGATGTGTVYLDAAVGSWDWAQVRIERAQEGGHTVTRWASSGALAGGASGSSTGSTARISFENFVPESAIRPGPSTLSFRLERYGTLAVSRVAIGAGTGIVMSRLGPARVVARVAGPTHVRRGMSARVTVRVENAGDRPVSALRLGWDLSSSTVTIAPATRTVARLAPHRAHTAVFRLTARHLGVARLFLSALGPSVGTTRTYTVVVRRR